MFSEQRNNQSLLIFDEFFLKTKGLDSLEVNCPSGWTRDRINPIWLGGGKFALVQNFFITLQGSDYGHEIC